MPYRIAVARVLLAASVLFAGSIRAQTAARFLGAADTLLDDLETSALSSPAWPNVYGATPYIDWAGPHSSARTSCSSFTTLLWQHTFGWTPAAFKAWMGHSSPTAAVYHDTIANGVDFTRVPTVDLIRPGDIIAIVYYPEYQAPTGHVMIVEDVPQPNASNPIIAGTQQWTITVLDSSNSYHGTTDTRYLVPGGIGRGVFRLYSHADGTVAGYTWSLLGTSLASFYPQATTTASGHHIVIGRLARSIFQSGFDDF
jgi:hypothetical protein